MHTQMHCSFVVTYKYEMLGKVPSIRDARSLGYWDWGNGEL